MSINLVASIHTEAAGGVQGECDRGIASRIRFGFTSGRGWAELDRVAVKLHRLILTSGRLRAPLLTHLARLADGAVDELDKRFVVLAIIDRFHKKRRR